MNSLRLSDRWNIVCMLYSIVCFVSIGVIYNFNSDLWIVTIVYILLVLLSFYTMYKEVNNDSLENS